MNIIELLDKKQDLQINNENKEIYGEIFTPYSFIKRMFNLIPESFFKNPDSKWLDPGAGSGFFSIFLFNILYVSLKERIPDSEKRKTHITENMIYMVEINIDNILKLKEVFGENANIYHNDFLLFNENIQFDFIIGNPPFNSNGLKKVPTNNSISKRKDGSTIWCDFVKKSISLLKKGGFLCFITPSIWLKPDKAGMYNYILQFKIQKLNCISNTETNSIFNKGAQTPCCFYLLENKPSDNIISIYDKSFECYENYQLDRNKPIPVFGIKILNKINKFLNNDNKLFFYKSNLPQKNTILIDKENNDYYKNIHTCILQGNKPYLIFKYSNKPCPFYGKKKLIMAHGMYGFPFIDKNGEYGISNRDKYIIVDNNLERLEKLKRFFSTKFSLYLFECTRYRMKYLEKYIFELIPDISKLSDFPSVISNDSIMDYFDLSQEERNIIENFQKKKYDFFLD